MAVTFSPIFNHQVVDSTGAPASGWLVYTYAAGSSTPLACYTTQTGDVAQSNPIVLNSLGFPTTGQIWLTEGIEYKLVLTDASDVVQKTEDDVSGVPILSSSTFTEWVTYSAAPTYISATSFSVAGDQRSIFNVGRRLKSSNTAGTIYSTISAVAYSSVTTVTVVNDSGTLDSGLSSVSYGMISSENGSLPVRRDVIPGFADVTDPTKRLRIDVGSITTGTVRVATISDRDFTLGKIQTIQTFTASGTYTKPSGCIGALVKCQAPGGGGGGADSDGTGTGAAGGGGGGGYSEKIILGADLGATETVTIGAVGAAGSATNGTTGGTGGTTSFGAHVSCTGGAGGVGTGVMTSAAGHAFAGGAGGAGSSGTINAEGGDGGSGGGYGAGFGVGGTGGSSIFGAGGAGGASAGAASTAPGSAGNNYGGGGGGAADVSAGAGAAGGAGGPGLIIVYEFY